MEPSPFDQPPPPPASPPLPPEPPPPQRYGAGAATPSHPGGWAAVAGFSYGVVGTVFATTLIVTAVSVNAALGAAEMALQNVDVEASEADLAILDRGGETIAFPLLALGMVSLAIGLAATLAGAGVLRRSERARVALLAVLAASAVACVGWCVYSITSYTAAVQTWAREYQEASGRLGIDADLGQAFEEGASSAFSDACTAGVHLLVIAGLVAALRSASARAWCGASDAPLSKQALERSRLPR